MISNLIANLRARRGEAIRLMPSPPVNPRTGPPPPPRPPRRPPRRLAAPRGRLAPPHVVPSLQPARGKSCGITALRFG